MARARAKLRSALQGSRNEWREAQSKVASLTPREIEVLAHVVGGLTNLEIADTLNIAPRTVEVHRQNLRAKLGEKTSGGAARVAIYAALANGIIA